MEPLIPITGMAKSYKELTTKIAMDGEFWNVIGEEYPFVTYRKTGETEVGDTMEETDILGWYQVRAELESNVPKPDNGDVYIIGISSPYTRYKAVYESGKHHWEEDGFEEKKILKRFKDVQRFSKTRYNPEEGIWYAFGKEAPYKLYGVVSSWEPVGSYISYTPKTITRLINAPLKYNYGEIAFVEGLFYVYTGERWEQLPVPEPVSSLGKHIFVADNGRKMKMREGFVLGTYEYYEPKGLN